MFKVFKCNCYNTESKVEKLYEEAKGTSIRTLVTDNYVELGKLTALRFLEWVSLNPGGVVSLPTGKTPEFFIKWVNYYLNNWEKEEKNGIIGKLEIAKPDMKSIYFFQMDEFCDIEPEDVHSFHYFIKKYYVDGFGFDHEKVTYIDTKEFYNRGKYYLNDYEEKIRSMGGIGFFLGGIGPDGHIAFNMSGSPKDSRTRVEVLNYPSAAAASTDFGGISNTLGKEAITIGLDTIAYNNEDHVAIIIAAGNGKSDIVKQTVSKPMFDFIYPATILNTMKHGAFYITESVRRNWVIYDNDKYLAKVKEYKPVEGQIIMHTSPHHDDVELAYYPLAQELLKDNENYFVYCTQGYTSVTDDYLISVLECGINDYKKFVGYKESSLDMLMEKLCVVEGDSIEPVARYILREIEAHLYPITRHTLLQAVKEKDKRYTREIHLLKSWIREFEAQSVWYYNDVKVGAVKHLRLPFYSDDIFPRYPEYEKDVKPIVEYMERIRPDIITLALDPEGSGPDTHFKTILALQMAINEYHKKYEYPIRIWGYRNVWSEFNSLDGELTEYHVSVKQMREFRDMFKTFYQTQKNAEFPSYKTNKPFCDIAIDTWLKQERDTMWQGSRGSILFKDMSIDEFNKWMEPLKRVLDNQPKNNTI